MQLTLNDYAKQNQAPPLQGRSRGWGLSAEHLAELHRFASEMRRNPTEPEKRLWRYLSNSQLEGFKFRRQEVVGWSIADFACPSVNLIVEVDGDTHDDPAKDQRRDAKLGEFGYRIVRVTNLDVMHNMEGVLTLISEALREAAKPHPNPVDAFEVNHAPGMVEGLPGAIPTSTASTPEGEGLKERISLEGSVG